MTRLVLDEVALNVMLVVAESRSATASVRLVIPASSRIVKFGMVVITGASFTLLTTMLKVLVVEVLAPP